LPYYIISEGVGSDFLAVADENVTTQSTNPSPPQKKNIEIYINGRVVHAPQVFPKSTILF
jgi:hypothetical protein